MAYIYIMSLHYIYITTNNINGKKYLGQRKSQKQNPENDKYFGSGILITKALKKYGKENFSKEIIFTCDNRKEIDFAEIKYIKEYGCLENKDVWYNRDGGGQRWRHEGHSEAVSKTMKEFYSDPRNRYKSLASRLGITVDECYLMQTRKTLINTLKKVKRIKEKEQSDIKKAKEKEERKAYFSSPEYKNRIKKNNKIRSENQSNSDDFKKKVAEGKARAIAKNPDIYKHKHSISDKIKISKIKVGDKATFIHKLFWDKNSTIESCDKKYRYKIKTFIRGYESIRYIEKNIVEVHQMLKEMGMHCDVKEVSKFAYSNMREKRGKRERRKL